MRDKMEYERLWRETPPEDRLKFIADQVFTQGQSIAEFKMGLIDHERRLIGLEGRNSSKGEPRKRANHNKLIFTISAAVTAGIAGAVTAGKALGWIK